MQGLSFGSGGKLGILREKMINFILDMLIWKYLWREQMQMSGMH